MSRWYKRYTRDIDNDIHKTIVNKSILFSAWVQVSGGLLFGGRVMYWVMRRRRNK
jgi:hypothetical protein